MRRRKKVEISDQQPESLDQKENLLKVQNVKKIGKIKLKIGRQEN